MNLKLNLVVTVFAGALLSITKVAVADFPIQISEPQQLGDGEVRVHSFVAGRYPIGMGFTFDGGVFNNAPMEHSDGRWDILNGSGEIVWRCCGHELVFEAPKNIARTTAFTHFVMNWNPHGHPPPMIYSVPHIDFHFYTQSPLDRDSITPPAAEDMCNDNVYGIPPLVPLDCDQLELAMKPLPADQQPPDYISVGAVEPGMGNHLIDPGAPEFQGQDFSHTFIFGSWDGALTFWEPMITVDYLFSVRNRCFPIKNPSSAPEAGWYPSRYCIQYNRHQDIYNVSLTHFRWLTASKGN